MPPRAVISGETTQGRDVVVVAHSYGGIVGSSAVKGFTLPRRRCRPGPAPAATPATPQRRGTSSASSSSPRLQPGGR